MQNIPDYSNLKFSLADMNKFFKDQGIKLDQKQTQKLNSVFGKFDKLSEKQDGEISKSENREEFMKTLEKDEPKIFDKLIEFSIAVEMAEDMRQEQQKNIKQKDK